jgi:hypothetical protein
MVIDSDWRWFIVNESWLKVIYREWVVIEGDLSWFIVNEFVIDGDW